ncbi:MAG: UDP-glucose 6-dehydrogenase [Ktedonobacterales bacterium]|jgi:UDPglucose 6-dehydrogenase|nr:MAG: UDP-glucose 6-dehydrogenase [Ktedonobacterales bacterium]
MKRICVVGTGYVGLVTGACLADLGNSVICLDIVDEKIERLRAGELPIFEPGLDAIVRRTVAAKRLSFTTDYSEGVPGVDYIFIAVNTPTGPDGAGADMSHVEDAAKSIAENLTHDVIVINKSTMPVGSGNLVSQRIHEHLRDTSLKVSVVSNPEFLREGVAVHDFKNPDRIVLGSTDRDAADAVAKLYLPLRAPIMITNLYTAEMIKYASNAFLATKISFINEMARICDLLGADVTEVAEGMGYDKRIGRAFLNAGLGYGGSCFPKDIKALAFMADEVGLHPQLIEAVMKINHDQRRLAVERLEAALGGSDSLRGKNIAVLGLAFKDNTDDMREAPAIDIINWLIEAGANVHTYDPVAVETAQRIQPDWQVRYCDDELAAVTGCQGVIIVTEWKRFRELNLAELRAVMAEVEGGPVLIDGRNLFNAEEATIAGFRYFGIGRGVERARGVTRSRGEKRSDTKAARNLHKYNGDLREQQ